MSMIFYDEIFLQHDTGYHPECAARLTAIKEHFEKAGLWREELPPIRDATPGEISMVHHRVYIEKVRKIADECGGMLDPDTVVSHRSYEAAVRAVGALFEACDAVMSGKDKSALCLVRPPGHHALPTRGMGFCIFNNIALAARYLQKKHGVSRVAIVDWDVHHGNGTQEVFYEDDTVLYFSIHRYPFYPGTGSADEKGAGKGLGFTINRPVPYNISRERYFEIFREVLTEQVRDFSPQVLLISAGFDAHRQDPIGGLCLEAADFAELTKIVREVAEHTADGRVVSALEGGYNLRTLPDCVAQHLSSLP